MKAERTIVNNEGFIVGKLARNNKLSGIYRTEHRVKIHAETKKHKMMLRAERELFPENIKYEVPKKVTERIPRIHLYSQSEKEIISNPSE